MVSFSACMLSLCHVKVEAPEASQISLVANMAGMNKQVRRGILKRPRDEHEIDETDHENAEKTIT